MLRLVFIATGGAIGAVLRDLIGSLPARYLGEGFPYGTLVVNLLGSLLIGILYELTERSVISAELKPLLITGLLGALTTFSSHSLDNLKLVEGGTPHLALLNIIVSITLGLLFAFCGASLIRALYPA
ncbi:MAG: fluoride efflux transporter CrcB [Candidatus Promineifilaceae bacterium]